MKRIFSCLLAVIIAFSLAACSQADGSEISTSLASKQDGTASGNILIAYFSWADNAVFAEDVDSVSSPSVLPPGNVQQLAGWVQEETGGDLFSIQVTDPYPSDWDDCLARANEERGADARPELKAGPETLDGYDEIFLGYPNYWGTMPMAVFTFLEHYDFTGKTIHPFCTHEGSGMGRSEADIKRLCPGAIVTPGLAIHGSAAAKAEKDIRNWLNL